MVVKQLLNLVLFAGPQGPCWRCSLPRQWSMVLFVATALRRQHRGNVIVSSCRRRQHLRMLIVLPLPTSVLEFEVTSSLVPPWVLCGSEQLTAAFQFHFLLSGC